MGSRNGMEAYVLDGKVVASTIKAPQRSLDVQRFSVSSKGK